MANSPASKVCPDCDSIVALSATECPDCGYVFPAREVKIAPTAATLPVLSPKQQWLPVTGVSYSRHDKAGGRPSLKVTYSCGLANYSEWVCLEHQGYARQKAAEWWRKRAPGCPVPLSVAEALAQTMGGEYLEAIGKSDLATLSEEEWARFLDAVVTGYCDHLRALAAKDRNRLDAMAPEVPF